MSTDREFGDLRQQIAEGGPIAGYHDHVKAVLRALDLARAEARYHEAMSAFSLALIQEKHAEGEIETAKEAVVVTEGLMVHRVNEAKRALDRARMDHRAKEDLRVAANSRVVTARVELEALGAKVPR